MNIVDELRELRTLTTKLSGQVCDLQGRLRVSEARWSRLAIRLPYGYMYELKSTLKIPKRRLRILVNLGVGRDRAHDEVYDGVSARPDPPLP